MSRYNVYVTPAAWKEIKKLPGQVRQRVRKTVDTLAEKPRPAKSKALEVGAERKITGSRIRKNAGGRPANPHSCECGY